MPRIGLKKLAILSVASLAGAGTLVTAGLLLTERSAKHHFAHPLMETRSLGTHYLINDIAGIGAVQEALPYAVVLSHSALPSVISEGPIGSPVLSSAGDFGISQDSNIAGWGATTQRWTGESPVTIEYFRTAIVVKVSDALDFDRSPSLRMSFPWHSRHAAVGGIDVRRTASNGTDLQLEINGSGEVWIEPTPPPSDGYPIEFALANIAPEQVRIGSEGLKPTASDFSLATQDMHSLAIGELDGLPTPEVSIVRGGVRGEIGRVSPEARDILIDAGTRREIANDYVDFKKNGCPGRQSAWTDIDGDRDLDLYVVCGRSGGGANHRSPNLLYINDSGRFYDAAREFGLDIDAAGTFRFIDWDGDLDPDLWWAGASGELILYRNDNSVFTPDHREQWTKNEHRAQILVHDFHKDGDPDILILHRRQNLLLINDAEQVERRDPSTVGLPARTAAGAFIDVDLDGELDLVTSMNGVFLGAGNGQYEHAGIDFTNKFFVKDSRIVSYDGKRGRELIVAYRSCLPGKFCGGRRVLLASLREYLNWPIERLENFRLFEPYTWQIDSAVRKSDKSPNNEYTIAIDGHAYNPHSLGARIDLKWNRVSESHWVGEAESSLYSQANYAIYSTIPVCSDSRDSRALDGWLRA